MNKLAPIAAEMPEAVRVDDVVPVVVGPGCLRRDLPSTDDLRVWMVDMAPGSVWPVVDEHDTGEEVYVVEGEVIEGDRRFGAGTCLCFQPGSRHRPRTEKGARLSGITHGETHEGAFSVCERVLGRKGSLPRAEGG